MTSRQLPIRSSRYTTTLAAVLTLATVACEDPSTLAEEEALLAEEGEDDVDLDANDQLVAASDDDVEELVGYTVVSNVSWNGSSVVVPPTNPNDPVWVLNAPNGVWGDLSRVTATIRHDGFLNGQYGWGHLGILTRGTTLEPSLQYLGYPSGTSTLAFMGESLAGAGAHLSAFLRGRGPAFYAKGTAGPTIPGLCPTIAQQPCVVFENFSRHHLGGDVLIGPGIPLSLTDEPFQVRVDTDDFDIKIWVLQGGQVKAYASCLQHTGGDARCGAQPGDSTVGDATFGFVMNNLTASGIGKSVGVQSSSSKVLNYADPAPCPGCQPY